MKITLKSKIDIAFALLATVFAILIYLTYSQAMIINDNREIINDARNINTVFEKVLSSISDVETGARGYVITGQENYLSVYKAGDTNVDGWMDSLREIGNNDSMFTKRLHGLDRLIKAKKAISKTVVDTRRDLGMEKASQIVKTGRGRQVMDSIRTYISKYQKEQVALLSKKLEETEDTRKLRNISFGLFVLFTVFFGFVTYRKIRENAKKITNDGTLQAKLSEELAFQNLQLNDFANITSHNLRSSAANMTSLIEIAEEKSTLEDYKMIFEMMKKVSGNLNDSLNELIEILHIKRNTSVEKENLSFEEVLTTVTETLQGEILKSEATIISDFSGAPHVLFSKIYLESIIQNLVGNALKYRSPERKPVVSVCTFKNAGRIILEVSDNGLGIDLNRYGHKIFGMHQVFHKHPEAKGIGLFMTKAQIESQGGKIEVQSNGTDGTTFSVYFPE